MGLDCDQLHQLRDTTCVKFDPVALAVSAEMIVVCRGRGAMDRWQLRQQIQQAWLVH